MWMGGEWRAAAQKIRKSTSIYQLLSVQSWMRFCTWECENRKVKYEQKSEYVRIVNVATRKDRRTSWFCTAVDNNETLDHFVFQFDMQYLRFDLSRIRKLCAAELFPLRAHLVCQLTSFVSMKFNGNNWTCNFRWSESFDSPNRSTKKKFTSNCVTKCSFSLNFCSRMCRTLTFALAHEHTCIQFIYFTL